MNYLLLISLDNYWDTSWDTKQPTYARFEKQDGSLYAIYPLENNSYESLKRELLRLLKDDNFELTEIEEIALDEKLNSFRISYRKEDFIYYYKIIDLNTTPIQEYLTHDNEIIRKFVSS